MSKQEGRSGAMKYQPLYDYELCLEDAKDDKYDLISPCLLPKEHLGAHKHVGLCKTSYCACQVG